MKSDSSNKSSTRHFSVTFRSFADADWAVRKTTRINARRQTREIRYKSTPHSHDDEISREHVPNVPDFLNIPDVPKLRFPTQLRCDSCAIVGAAFLDASELGWPYHLQLSETECQRAPHYVSKRRTHHKGRLALDRLLVPAPETAALSRSFVTRLKARTLSDLKGNLQIFPGTTGGAFNRHSERMTNAQNTNKDIKGGVRAVLSI